MAGTRNQNKLLQQGKQQNKITYTKKIKHTRKKSYELNETG